MAMTCDQMSCISAEARAVRKRSGWMLLDPDENVARHNGQCPLSIGQAEGEYFPTVNQIVWGS